jgi:hypothetical protein
MRSFVQIEGLLEISTIVRRPGIAAHGVRPRCQRAE